MKFKKLLVNIAIVATSVGIGVLVCEFAARIVLNPADYLNVQMVGDEVLGAVPSPSARASFDQWGFRNRTVPKTAEIVAIGDSHTFGNTARMEDSWPYVLQRLTGVSVYNMGMGGYGPNQYYYLLKTRALSLKPKVVICGLYMGDDFDNAYTITYGLDYWKYLRQGPALKADYNIWGAGAASPPSEQKKVRIWLSQHSVLYQIVLHGPLMGQTNGELQIKNAPKYDPLVTSLILPEYNILEAFRPTGLLKGLDQDSASVREGMRITFELLKEMNDICNQNHIQFLVVVIPTKESVFSGYLEHDSHLQLSGTIDKLIANERLAREKLFKFLGGGKIPYVDTLPDLKKSLGNQLYARTAADMHPNKNGYRVIGEAVSATLKQMLAKN